MYFKVVHVRIKFERSRRWEREIYIFFIHKPAQVIYWWKAWLESKSHYSWIFNESFAISTRYEYGDQCHHTRCECWQINNAAWWPPVWYLIEMLLHHWGFGRHSSTKHDSTCHFKLVFCLSVVPPRCSRENYYFFFGMLLKNLKLFSCF